jgi:hypothetical protein
MPKLNIAIRAGWSIVLAICLAPAQQQNNPHVTTTERFAGSVRVRGQDQPVKVLIQNWTIDERQTIASLPLPAGGTVVAQLRGGKLITIIDGKREPRQTEDWWTVPAGKTMGIETEDDTATLQVIVTGY